MKIYNLHARHITFVLINFQYRAPTLTPQPPLKHGDVIMWGETNWLCFVYNGIYTIVSMDEEWHLAKSKKEKEGDPLLNKFFPYYKKRYPEYCKTEQDRDIVNVDKPFL